MMLVTVSSRPSRLKHIGADAHLRSHSCLLRHHLFPGGQSPQRARCALGSSLLPLGGLLPRQVVRVQQRVPSAKQCSLSARKQHATLSALGSTSALSEGMQGISNPRLPARKLCPAGDPSPAGHQDMIGRGVQQRLAFSMSVSGNPWWL